MGGGSRNAMAAGRILGSRTATESTGKAFSNGKGAALVLFNLDRIGSGDERLEEVDAAGVLPIKSFSLTGILATKAFFVNSGSFGTSITSVGSATVLFFDWMGANVFSPVRSEKFFEPLGLSICFLFAINNESLDTGSLRGRRLEDVAGEEWGNAWLPGTGFRSLPVFNVIASAVPDSSSGSVEDVFNGKRVDGSVC